MMHVASGALLILMGVHSGSACPCTAVPSSWLPLMALQVAIHLPCRDQCSCLNIQTGAVSQKSSQTQKCTEHGQTRAQVQYLQGELVPLIARWVFAEVWEVSVGKEEQDCITQVVGPSDPSKRAVAVWAKEKRCNGSSKLY